MAKYDNTDIFLPAMDETEDQVLTMSESWFYDTISKLVVCTEFNKSNKLFEMINFNTTYHRVEALDGHRIGMRTLDERNMINGNTNVMLSAKCVPVFKAVTKHKSDSEIKMSQDKRYVKIEGTDYTYMIRRADGNYFDVNHMLFDDETIHFTVDRKEISDVMKYDVDLVKADKLPVVFYNENGSLHTYARTARYESIDRIGTKDLSMPEGFHIAFNPVFLLDAFKIIDVDNPVIVGKNSKHPIIIKGNEFSFFILPVNLKPETVEAMKERFTQDRVA
jgi:DNA polymerase III sliding clamp (beta) subunit (PCNA family)